VSYRLLRAGHSVARLACLLCPGKERINAVDIGRKATPDRAKCGESTIVVTRFLAQYFEINESGDLRPTSSGIEASVNAANASHTRFFRLLRTRIIALDASRHSSSNAARSRPNTPSR
jgi:hypothetical protein